MAYGTHAVPDLFRDVSTSTIDSPALERDLYQYISSELAAHNRITDDEMSIFVDKTTERTLGYGGASGVQFVKAGEFTRPDVSKPTAGGQFNIPMWSNQASVGWTRKYLANTTVERLLTDFIDVQRKDSQLVGQDLMNALCNSANRTPADHLVDRATLYVKALANADSFALPPDPFGNYVDSSTHTHYLARVSTLAATDIDAVLDTVAEHDSVGSVRLYLNRSNAAAVAAFTSANQYVAVPAAVYVQPTTSVVGVGTLDTTQTGNRQIGFWGANGYEVWVKPWVPANYCIAVRVGGRMKPLAWRERRTGSSGLTLAAESEEYPLRAATWEREYGVAVHDRLAAACLYIGGTSYVVPTI